jgi:hypothetical protein
MADALEGIEKQVRRRNFDSPPLHLWNPALSGDIPIRIAADGCWYHDGSPIWRESLVRLFASILRREDDGDYYLVTPAEKWRISVELHPLIVTDVAPVGEGVKPLLQATLNTGRKVEIGDLHALFFEPTLEQIPVLKLDHGLSALVSRPAWYRLVDLAEDRDGVPTLSSGDYHFALLPQP